MHKLLLAASLVLALVAPSTQAQIAPAQFAQGVITQINRDTGTFNVGADSYVLRRGGVTYLSRFSAGDQVEVTFIRNGGRREALSMRRLDPLTRNCLFEFLCAEANG